MSIFDTKVDAYIAKSQDFAKPILTHWREVIHAACPDVEEAIKWGIPHFDYKGEMMCMLTAYKNYCSFSFWKAELMSHAKLKDNAKLKPTKRYMGEIKSLADLPTDEELTALIKEAMRLNENGVKLVKPVSDKLKVTETPDYFTEKLATNAAAKAIFESKSSSFRKDYIIWIADAKTEATRQTRMEQSIDG